MNHNSINSVIPSQELQELQDLIQEFSEKISPYLISQIIPELLDGYAKLGDKSEGFVQRAIMHAQQEDRFIPGFANLSHAQSDYKLYKDLKGLQDNIEKLLNKVNQTRVLAGAEALDFANDFYKFTRIYARTKDPVAMVIYEDLKSRYKKNSAKRLQSES